MPWHVIKSEDKCSPSKPWAVILDADGSTAGCHETEAEAKAQMAALYANTEDASYSREAAAGRRRAAQERSATPQLAERSQRGIEGSTARRVAFPAELRTETVERDGKSFLRTDGYATTWEQPYEMWDVFGPYDEVVSRTAADATLAAKPDVVYLINHRGLSLARTGGPWNDNNSTLDLSVDEHGLRPVAWLNPNRSEVKDLDLAIRDMIVTEMSFGFMIDDGEWSEDMTSYRINRFDLNRGDVSAVTYGANPHTSIAVRQQEILADIERMGPSLARAVWTRLQQRTDLNGSELVEEYARAVAVDEKAGLHRGYSTTQLEAEILELTQR